MVERTKQPIRIELDDSMGGVASFSKGRLKASPDMARLIYGGIKELRSNEASFRDYVKIFNGVIMPQYVAWHRMFLETVDELRTDFREGVISKGESRYEIVKKADDHKVRIEPYLEGKIAEKCREICVHPNPTKFITGLIEAEENPFLHLCLRHARHETQISDFELMGAATTLWANPEEKDIKVKSPEDVKRDAVRGWRIEFMHQPLKYPSRDDPDFMDETPGSPDCYYSNFFLETVMENLIKNSRFAHTVKSEERKIRMGHSVSEEEVSLYVRDFGDGILPRDDMSETEVSEHIDRMFKPGETTKGRAGTGEGLYLIDQIVMQLLHGNITVESRGWKYDMKASIATQNSDITEGTRITVSWANKPMELR